jgi:nitrogen-specific signal transduction histidine kinase
VMAHGRDEAFDGEDARMMQLLANFGAMGFRQQRQQKELMEKERAAAAAAMANDLAHKINNPLQALTNQLYIASGSDSKLAQDMSADMGKLSALVKELLAIPFGTKFTR